MPICVATSWPPPGRMPTRAVRIRRRWPSSTRNRVIARSYKPSSTRLAARFRLRPMLRLRRRPRRPALRVDEAAREHGSGRPRRACLALRHRARWLLDAVELDAVVADGAAIVALVALVRRQAAQAGAAAGARSQSDRSRELAGIARQQGGARLRSRDTPRRDLRGLAGRGAGQR